MNHTLFLDIDHVLIPWSHKGDKTGWEFQTANERFLPRYSPDQLTEIADNFNVEWLTTWNIRVEGVPMVHGSFTPVTGFGPYPRAIDKLQLHGRNVDFNNEDDKSVLVNEYRDSQYTVIEDNELRNLLGGRDSWFKLNVIAALEVHGLLPEKFLWVDDELEDREWQVAPVIDYLELRDRAWIHAPWDGWSRDNIEAAKEWLES